MKHIITMHSEQHRHYGDVWSEETRHHAHPDEYAAQKTEVKVRKLTAQKAHHEC